MYNLEGPTWGVNYPDHPDMEPFTVEMYEKLFDRDDDDDDNENEEEHEDVYASEPFHDTYEEAYDEW